MNRKQIKSIAKQIEILERELETAEDERSTEIETEIMAIIQKVFREKDAVEIMEKINEIVVQNMAQ